MKLNKTKLTVYLIVFSLANYGAYTLGKDTGRAYKTYQKGVAIERAEQPVMQQPTMLKPAQIPAFKLSNNIDQYEADKALFWAKMEASL